ncbi:MAG: MogA/MoaB family molybdenum cofactor biosynthesis protein [Ruminococcaceae bacterium]|nr:MogA/MoaB family molybdenum cofactor biosynthesis protein [Oscillospiraceae bacterium]
MYKAIVITVSDRCYKKEREDLAGPTVKQILIENGYDVNSVVIIPDEKEYVIDVLKKSVEDNINFIVTTGGTGFSKRDITPECTKEIIDRDVPGVAEYMRLKSFEITPRAMLSRGLCGIKNNSLILNLPGSPKAAKENLEAVVDTLKHGLDILTSKSSDCAR